MRRIRGLDGVRGFSSLIIVGFHVLYYGGYLGDSRITNMIFARGDCFVRCFFMLSGFSLMCAYFPHFCDGKFDTAAFLRRRAWRLLPCFWLAELAFVCVNFLNGAPNDIREIIGTASLLFVLFPSGRDSIVWAGWSTGIQAVFYLLFPSFLAVCKTKKSTWLSLAASGALLYAYTGFYAVDVQSPHINIARHLIYFIAGALLFHYKDALTDCSGCKRACAGILCVVVEVGCFFAFRKTTFGKIDEDAVMLLAFSALIVLQILGGGTDPIMRLPIFTWLGDISYEIYIFHSLVYVILRMLVARWHFSINGYYMHLIMVLVPTIILAYGVHNLLPILQRQWKRLLLAKSPEVNDP